MTTRRGFGRPLRARGARTRRKLVWRGSSLVVNSLANGSVAIGTVLDPRVTVAMIGATLVRIHGEFGARNVATGNMSSGAQVSGGILVVTGAARDAGAGSVPSPFVDVGASWVWHRDMIMQGTGSDAPLELVRALIDVKAKRKLGSQDVLTVSLANEANVVVDMFVVIRYLMMLP